jgi:hypothetical protein
MTQMSGSKEESGAVLSLNKPNCKFFALALELLRGCGMILRVQLLRTSPTDGRCHRADGGLKSPLSFRVHPSSVICCNGLNLSRGSRV